MLIFNIVHKALINAKCTYIITNECFNAIMSAWMNACINAILSVWFGANIPDTFTCNYAQFMYGRPVKEVYYIYFLPAIKLRFNEEVKVALAQ